MEYNSDNLEANQEMLRDHSDRLHYVHSIQSNKQRPMCVIWIAPMVVVGQLFGCTELLDQVSQEMIFL